MDRRNSRGCLAHVSLRKVCALSCVAFSAICSDLTARAQSYTGVDLYTLLPSPVAVSFFGGSAYGGQVVGMSGNIAMTGPQHALVWTGPGEPVDLTPTAGGENGASATDGVHQVGGTGGHAYLWTGTAASGIDLHPTSLNEFTYSGAAGVAGGQQVGSGTALNPDQTVNFRHALLWAGTASSVVDLNPANMDDSEAFATDGTYQVGDGTSNGTGGNPHALLWNGAAASAIDLHPASMVGIDATIAYGVGGGQQVGLGAGTATGEANHAFVWSGTASSAVDLNPSTTLGATSSLAYGVNAGHQVGFAAGNDFHHAVAWSGTADSAVDLNALLPFSAAESDAYSIDAQGDIFGVAMDADDVSTHAVEWVPVPEPAPVILASEAIACLLVMFHFASSHASCRATRI